ncbi:MAG: PKD domain-containing protein [Cytophagales bacterium]|nr:PKD domain-containing protein [Cytophagales bacterium]
MKRIINSLVMASLLATISFNCQEDSETTPAGSFARFSTSQDFLTVTFTNESDSEASGFSWDFGNGQTSTDENPSITYSDFGSYDVTLTVQGKAEAIVTATINVTSPEFISALEAGDAPEGLVFI